MDIGSVLAGAGGVLVLAALVYGGIALYRLAGLLKRFERIAEQSERTLPSLEGLVRSVAAKQDEIVGLIDDLHSAGRDVAMTSHRVRSTVDSTMEDVESIRDIGRKVAAAAHGVQAGLAAFSNGRRS